MAELLAQGPLPRDRWRRELPAERIVVLGRGADGWSVPWDHYLSRQHAQLSWRDGELHVEQLNAAPNPIYFQGQAVSQCTIKPGQQFAIGETTFQFIEQQPTEVVAAAQVVKERTFKSKDLKKLRVQNAVLQLEVLSRLPHVISGAGNDQELFVGLGNLLLGGLPQADGIALVRVTGPDGPDAASEVLYRDRRNWGRGEFQPSRRLILEAMRKQETTLHIWSGSTDVAVSQDASFDWAFCCPLPGVQSAGWGIYVAGRFGDGTALTAADPADASGLGDELLFTKLVAETWSSLRYVNHLKERQTRLAPFFPQTVLEMLGDRNPDEVLKPRNAELAVLFCDLRGFSREAEKSAEDLLNMLERVSKALGYMTQSILDHKGVIGDFHGDAAMGFWGWPSAAADMIQRACLAALGIRAHFEALGGQPNHPLAGFRVGIGIAAGPAVAGKIGTVNQVKVTAFGPVVNLASRLEGMTKILRVPILLDEAAGNVVQLQMPKTVARVRRLARVRPYGLDTPLTVSELVPPVSDYPLLSDEHLTLYESALDAFLAGDWTGAYERLHELPAQDRGKDYLMKYIIENNYTPPPGWDGVMLMPSK